MRTLCDVKKLLTAIRHFPSNESVKHPRFSTTLVFLQQLLIGEKKCLA